VDEDTLVSDPPAGGTTGSTTAGAHDAHVTINGFLCNDCHVDNVASGLHNNGLMTITMGFSPFGGGYEGGTYDGQPPPVSYDSSHIDTTVSNPGTGTKTCANLYCHGNYPGSGLNASPVWDSPPTGDCGTCHGASNTTYPVSGTHEEHASESRFEFQCTLCHQDVVGGSGPDSYTITDLSQHVNGSVDWAFDVTDPRLSGSSTYGIADGTERPSDGTTPRAYDACQNIYCHSIAQTATGGGITPDTSDYKTPTWGTNLGCGGCHNRDLGHAGSGLVMDSGSHTIHLAYLFTITGNPSRKKCITCHKLNASASNACAQQCHSTEYDYHANNQVDVLFDTEFGNASYNGTLTPGDGFSDCANTYCHSNGSSVATLTIPANTSPMWGSGALACDACHGNGPDYVNGAPKANSHAEHSSYTCDQCHSSTTTTGNTITNTTNHVNLAYDLQAGAGVSFSYSFATTGGTCSTISCHGGNSATWGTLLSCSDCHGQPPNGDTFPNRAGSHTTHFTPIAYGPQINLGVCDDCHYLSPATHGDGQATFIGSQPLADTAACDTCHSPGGVFNGVVTTSDSVGAKDNWDPGVYTGSGATMALQAGKEKWCVGCHDSSASVINGVLAPAIAGDDITYGYYYSGHGRNLSGVQCTDCHDSSVNHLDGEPRTYAFDTADYAPAQSGVAYASGYRLGYVSSEVPLMIPANYGTTFGWDAGVMRDTAFRLCFNCHNSSEILDDTPGDGINSNFKASQPDPPRNYSYAWGSGADTNEHVAHIMNYTGPFADSDWDTATDGPGGSNGRDSMTACSSCHNVHGAAGVQGSTNEAMIRDGILTGRTGYGFSYVIEDIGSGGYPWVTSTGATQAASVGAIFRSNTDNMCGVPCAMAALPRRLPAAMTPQAVVGVPIWSTTVPGSSIDAHGKGLNGSEIFLKERGYYDTMEKVQGNDSGDCLVCRQ